MAMAPRADEFLLGIERTPAGQFDLLRRAGCLSSHGLAHRASVIALLEHVRNVYEPPSSAAIVPPGSSAGPSLADELGAALLKAEYLDTAVWPVVRRLQAPSSWRPIDVEQALGMLREEIHVALNPAPPPVYDTLRVPQPDQAMSARDLIGCPTCRRYLPGTAFYCGWCGHRLI